MRCHKLFPRGATALVACAIASGLAGCQTVDTELAGFWGDTASTVAAPKPPMRDGPIILVELRQDGRKPTVVQLPLNEPSYIQQALEQSGATKKFRRMKIELYRQLPNGGGHKIPVTFDRSQHRVPPGSDYFLHANDRIVVIEDTSNAVDDILDSVGGPMKDMIHG